MRTFRIIVLLAVVAVLPTLAKAADLAITSSTQYLWYSDPLSTKTNQGEAVEYLRLNSGLDEAGNIRIVGYGRILRQFQTSPESSGANWFGRLYYLSLDYKDVIKDHFDLRAGRLYVNQAAIPGVVDGLYLNFKNLGFQGFGVTAFGGHRAVFDNKGEVSTSADTLWGASAYLSTALQTHVELSYARKYDNGAAPGASATSSLAQEFAALDFSTTPIQQVNVTARGNYDISQSRVSEVLVQANVTPVKQLIIRGEYYQSLPTFDKWSFYSFFSVTKYQQWKLGGEYQFNPNYKLHVTYADEIFDTSTNANLWDAGLFLRPVDALTLDLAYQYRNGYAGNLNGLRLHGTYRVGTFAVLAGADYADFKLDTFQAQMDTNAKKYWVGLSFDFSKYVTVTVRGEEDFNFYFAHGFQGLAALNVNI